MIAPAVEAQFARQMECARAAGIYHATFLAFGSLLGYVREGGVIPHDHDMDIGIDRSLITAEQEDEYLRLVQLPCDAFPKQPHGICEYRLDSARRPDDGRLFWMSLKASPHPDGCSCCHWFFWRHAGYAWHAKGHNALVKGMPEDIFGAGGPEVTFMRSKVHLPKFPGAMLDMWYRGCWMVPQSGGNSSCPVTLSVKDWNNKSTWRVVGG